MANVLTYPPPMRLLLARVTAEEISGVSFVSSWEATTAGEGWHTHVRLTAEVPNNSQVASHTDWYLQVGAAYPWGPLWLSPWNAESAKEQGLDRTFPHQLYNEPIEDYTFLTGNICTSEPGIIHQKQLISSAEPFTSEGRLQWHLRRAIKWVEAAAHNDLVRPGERYELPMYPKRQDLTVAFREDENTLEVWRSTTVCWGLIRGTTKATGRSTAIIQRFESTQGETICAPVWGTALSEINDDDEQMLGGWILFDTSPTLDPYHVPSTWRELREVASDQAFELEKSLRGLAQHFLPGRKYLLLVGFPIPLRARKSNVRVHWQPILLPSVSAVPKQKSFAKTVHKRLQTDHTYKQFFKHGKRIQWGIAENWATDQLAMRGELDPLVLQQRVAMVGAGALGSAVSDMLVRCGCSDIAIIDSERLEGGNLRRHVLGMRDVGTFKATALANHLNAASMDATTEDLPLAFSVHNDETIDMLISADVVLDCTASDHVLAQLGQIQLDADTLFIILSLGFEADRLLAFAATGPNFPDDVYRKWARPHIEAARTALRKADLPMGIGCWHPLFPARWDHVLALAGSVIESVEDWMASPPSAPVGVVFERTGAGITKHPPKMLNEAVDG